MLWDPTFGTWQQLGITINSQMMVLSPGLDEGTQPFFGFDSGVQEQILMLAEDLR